MQTTTTVVGGKGSNPKTVLYVGGTVLEQSLQLWQQKSICMVLAKSETPIRKLFGNIKAGPNVNVSAGLEESINEAKLHSAFIPFGDIKDVNIPLDNTTGKHRGFAFVEFEDKDDAADATDNMHNSELYVPLRKNFFIHVYCPSCLSCRSMPDLSL